MRVCSTSWRPRPTEADPRSSRIALCDAGVRRLHVARDDSGAATYAQWLVGPEDHAAINGVNPDLSPPPGDGQVLLEGAYSYVAFRGAGAMGDAMHQLLEIARAEGNREAFTYVATDFLPSIRGCARVGFQLDHMRVSRRRLFARHVSFLPADDAARAAWQQATASRSDGPVNAPQVAAPAGQPFGDPLADGPTPA